MPAVRTPLGQPGRNPSTAKAPTTSGRIAGLPDMGLPQDSVSGSTIQAGELWIPAARPDDFRLVLGRRLDDGRQLGDIEWLTASFWPNNSPTLQPTARIKEGGGLTLEHFADMDPAVDMRYAKFTINAGGTFEAKTRLTDNTTRSLLAKILTIGGVKKGFALSGFNSAPDYIKVGTINVSLSAEATKNGSVNFDQAMNNVPLVLLTKGAGFTGQLDVRLASVADGSVEVTVYTHDGSSVTENVTVNWAAICSSAYAT